MRQEAPKMTEGATAYDEVSYPGHPFVETHPDHLAVLGSLLGMSPAPMHCCRVLELGCGEGANLIPMAFDAPDGKFVGIDLSEQSVRRGNAFIAKMGLSNIALRAFDIMDVGPDFGTFDYIIAHGVYSWVPDVVRDKVLEIYRQNLTPQGIAFASYNCYPGCFSRDIARHIMRYHVRGESGPQERVRQGRALMQFLAEASAEDTIYGFELRNQHNRVKDIDPQVLFHDDLSEVATPFFLYQVAQDAAKHGLQYLCDSAFSMSHLGRLSAKARERLAAIPEAEAVTREQYVDFVDGRAFRESLFCHAKVQLDRPIDPRRVTTLRLATSAVPADGEIDPAAPGVVTFKTENGSTLATDHRLSKAAIVILGACWPQSKSFADLVSAALTTLGTVAGEIKANIDEEADALAGLIFRAFAAGQFHLRFSPENMTTTISGRPKASALARKQAESGLVVTNLLHRGVSMKDETVRQFLLLVDGTRTLDQLVADLNASMVRTGNAAAVSAQDVVQNLGILAKLGLLVS
jgi:methyltransferase-like protein/predicted O-methyltransferase YrrM